MLSPPRVFQAMAIKSAINVYLKTGLSVNRAYTATNMRRTAESITGMIYKRGRGGLEKALHDLEVLIKANGGPS